MTQKVFFSKNFWLTFSKGKFKSAEKVITSRVPESKKIFKRILLKFCFRGIVALDSENRKNIYHMKFGAKWKVLLKGICKIDFTPPLGTFWNNIVHMVIRCVEIFLTGSKNNFSWKKWRHSEKLVTASNGLRSLFSEENFF